MDRRALLRTIGIVGAVAAAGCLSSGEGSPPGQTDTARDEGTASGERATTGGCDAASPPSPSTGEGLPDPEPYPDRPSSLTPESVREYVESYETAYRHNGVLAELAADDDCVRHLGASVTESDVTPSKNGYEATVTTRASYTGERCPSGTATPPPHSDLARKTVSYTVTARRLDREGTTLACSG